MFQEWFVLREENADLKERIETLQSELADVKENSKARLAELRTRNATLTVELERAASMMERLREAFDV